MKEETSINEITTESELAIDAPLTVLNCDDPILKKTSRKVKHVDDAMTSIVDDMIKTMLAHRGLGLAAPQVGLNKRFFIFIPHPEQLDEEDTEVDIAVAINPKIIEHEGEHIGYEGCLSYPDYVAQVRRAIKVKVRYYDLDMNRIDDEFSGLAARAFQHELDHLDGIIFTDRMEPDTLKHVDELKEEEDEEETDDEQTEQKDSRHYL